MIMHKRNELSCENLQIETLMSNHMIVQKWCLIVEILSAYVKWNEYQNISIQCSIYLCIFFFVLSLKQVRLVYLIWCYMHIGVSVQHSKNEIIIRKMWCKCNTIPRQRYNLRFSESLDADVVEVTTQCVFLHFDICEKWILLNAQTYKQMHLFCIFSLGIWLIFIEIFILLKS